MSNDFSNPHKASFAQSETMGGPQSPKSVR